MTITHEHATENEAGGQLGSIWLEITGKCQLRCQHCYAGSGPDGTHGTMTAHDWERVVGEAAALGCQRITFIGGEPVLNPGLPRLVRFALDLGMTVEVYSNLVHITPAMWHLLELPGVSLAASWYTDDREQHAAITGRDTWRQTRRNFEEAVRRGIPIRAGVVDGILPGQRTAEGEQELRRLGVTNVGTDHLREFGRGANTDPSQACGHCGHGRAAVLPDGSVTPCPMTRWMGAGSVREEPLADIVHGNRMRELTAAIPAPRHPSACKPDGDGEDCGPAETDACGPSYCNPDG